MPELIAKSPLSGFAFRSLGGATLSESPPTAIASIAPFKGQTAGLVAALAAQGLGYPAPNRFTETGATTLVWTGRDQVFLIGAAPQGLAGLAAITDQSDGWARLRLDGPAAEAVLSRLIPIDLRKAQFPPGHAARVALNHLNTTLLRRGPDSFEILVFRSMARTAWHEIETAMAGLAARAALA